MLLYILYEGTEIKFIFYDLKHSIQEAMRLSLVLVRVSVAEDGSAKSMTIFSPSSDSY
jgi:hypothetical protein